MLLVELVVPQHVHACDYKGNGPLHLHHPKSKSAAHKGLRGRGSIHPLPLAQLDHRARNTDGAFTGKASRSELERPRRTSVAASHTVTKHSLATIPGSLSKQAAVQCPLEGIWEQFSSLTSLFFEVGQRKGEGHLVIEWVKKRQGKFMAREREGGRRPTPELRSSQGRGQMSAEADGSADKKGCAHKMPKAVCRWGLSAHTWLRQARGRC